MDLEAFKRLAIAQVEAERMVELVHAALKKAGHAKQDANEERHESCEPVLAKLEALREEIARSAPPKTPEQEAEPAPEDPGPQPPEQQAEPAPEEPAPQPPEQEAEPAPEEQAQVPQPPEQEAEAEDVDSSSDPLEFVDAPGLPEPADAAARSAPPAVVSANEGFSSDELKFI